MILVQQMVAVAQLVRASACHAEGRRFESGQPPQNNIRKHAPVAQRIRASVFGTEGRGFNSLQARKIA